jgi:acetyl-CoA C-acetyltransferase
MPIEIKTRKGPVVFDKDESPRPETTLEKLSTLPPVFTKKGTITAGNAPGMNDGASAVVIMTRKKAEELGIKPLASITDYAQASRDAKYIASVPGLAIQKLLQKRNMSIENVDLIEINEAFAAVPLVSCKILDINEKTMDEKVNVNGSAVAVGHPIGASGARILMTLIYELKRQNKKTGIAAICSGMAQGDAILIEVE